MLSQSEVLRDTYNWGCFFVFGYSTRDAQSQFPNQAGTEPHPCSASVGVLTTEPPGKVPESVPY